jgi:nitrous oxidase accessory protein NosD
MFVASASLCIFFTQWMAAAPLPECSDNGSITSSCVMSHDHHTPVAIWNDNVTLDCQGHAVSSTAGQGNGISVRGFNNVRIKNCTVRGWDIGIGVDNTTGSVFLNDNLVLNNKTGYAINTSNTVYVKGGTVAFNSDDGIDLVDDAFVSISRVAVHDNVDKGITYKNVLSGNNIRLYVIENRVSRNDTGISIQAPNTRGTVCGNRFWVNKRNLSSNSIKVTVSDSRNADDFGVCTTD